MRTRLVLGATILLGLAMACGGKNTYTLYRNGSLSDTLRIHVATFDVDGPDDAAEINRDNCEQARELFQLHPAAVSKFWCEKGRYRKKAK